MNFISLDSQSPDSLVYDQGGRVVVFDQTCTEIEKNRTVIIRNNTHLEWYGMTTGQWHYSLHFITESGESLVRILLLAKNSHIQNTLRSTLTASRTLTNIHIISLAWNAGIITLNGVVEITAGIQKVSWHILEENIFLGSEWQIRGIPALLVHSDDVEAGHAARIERIPDEKLYYLRARGVPRDDATVMMIRSSVFWLFSWLDDFQKEEIMSCIIAIL